MLKELNTQEMNEIKGGVTQAEYCNTLTELISNNWSSWNQAQQTAALQASVANCLSQPEQEVP